jgi:hypothetical protein
LTDEAKLAALPTITLQFVHDTFHRFVRDAYVTSFACGSVTSEMAASFCRQRIEFNAPTLCFDPHFGVSDPFLAACSSSSSTLQPMRQALHPPVSLPPLFRSLLLELGHLFLKIA